MFGFLGSWKNKVGSNQGISRDTISVTDTGCNTFPERMVSNDTGEGMGIMLEGMHGMTMEGSESAEEGSKTRATSPSTDEDIREEIAKLKALKKAQKKGLTSFKGFAKAEKSDFKSAERSACYKTINEESSKSSSSEVMDSLQKKALAVMTKGIARKKATNNSAEDRNSTIDTDGGFAYQTHAFEIATDDTNLFPTAAEEFKAGLEYASDLKASLDYLLLQEAMAASEYADPAAGYADPATAEYASDPYAAPGLTEVDLYGADLYNATDNTIPHAATETLSPYVPADAAVSTGDPMLDAAYYAGMRYFKKHGWNACSLYPNAADKAEPQEYPHKQPSNVDWKTLSPYKGANGDVSLHQNANAELYEHFSAEDKHVRNADKPVKKGRSRFDDPKPRDSETCEIYGSERKDWYGSEASAWYYANGQTAPGNWSQATFTNQSHGSYGQQGNESPDKIHAQTGLWETWYTQKQSWTEHWPTQTMEQKQSKQNELNQKSSTHTEKKRDASPNRAGVNPASSVTRPVVTSSLGFSPANRTAVSSRNKPTSNAVLPPKNLPTAEFPPKSGMTSTRSKKGTHWMPDANSVSAYIDQANELPNWKYDEDFMFQLNQHGVPAVEGVPSGLGVMVDRKPSRVKSNPNDSTTSTRSSRFSTKMEEDIEFHLDRLIPPAHWTVPQQLRWKEQQKTRLMADIKKKKKKPVQETKKTQETKKQQAKKPQEDDKKFQKAQIEQQSKKDEATSSNWATSKKEIVGDNKIAEINKNLPKEIEDAIAIYDRSLDKPNSAGVLVTRVVKTALVKNKRATLIQQWQNAKKDHKVKQWLHNLAAKNNMTAKNVKENDKDQKENDRDQQKVGQNAEVDSSPKPKKGTNNSESCSPNPAEAEKRCRETHQMLKEHNKKQGELDRQRKEARVRLEELKQRVQLLAYDNKLWRDEQPKEPWKDPAKLQDKLSNSTETSIGDKLSSIETSIRLINSEQYHDTSPKQDEKMLFLSEQERYSQMARDGHQRKLKEMSKMTALERTQLLESKVEEVERKIKERKLQLALKQQKEELKKYNVITQKTRLEKDILENKKTEKGSTEEKKREAQEKELASLVKKIAEFEEEEKMWEFRIKKEDTTQQKLLRKAKQALMNELEAQEKERLKEGELLKGVQPQEGLQPQDGLLKGVQPQEGLQLQDGEDKGNVEKDAKKIAAQEPPKNHDISSKNQDTSPKRGDVSPHRRKEIVTPMNTAKQTAVQAKGAQEEGGQEGVQKGVEEDSPKRVENDTQEEANLSKSGEKQKPEKPKQEAKIGEDSSQKMDESVDASMNSMREDLTDHQQIKEKIVEVSQHKELETRALDGLSVSPVSKPMQPCIKPVENHSTTASKSIKAAGEPAGIPVVEEDKDAAQQVSGSYLAELGTSLVGLKFGGSYSSTAKSPKVKSPNRSFKAGGANKINNSSIDEADAADLRTSQEGPRTLKSRNPELRGLPTTRNNGAPTGSPARKCPVNNDAGIFQ